MQVVLEIPDRLEELSLELLAEMLGLSINDANGMVKSRGIFDDFSLEEFLEQRKSMERCLGN